MRLMGVTGRCGRAVPHSFVLALAVFAAGCDDAASRGAVGGPAPDFEFTPIDGKTQRLSELRGKPVIVNFFATWCGPCMEELPELDRKIASAYADRGLVVIAVGIDQKPEHVAKFEMSTKHSCLIVSDPSAEILTKFTSDDVIPQTYLIKPDGTIGMHLVGYAPGELDQLKSQVEKLLPASK